MPDITTVWDPLNNRGDWVVASPPTGGDILDLSGLPIDDLTGAPITDLGSGGAFTPGLVSGDDLTTSVIISIYTDAQASADDVLPPGQTDRRGWWADPTMGSKLWLRFWLPCDTDTANLIQADLRDCLQWLIDDGVAVKIAVQTSLDTNNPGRIDALIRIYKTDGTVRVFADSWAWGSV